LLFDSENDEGFNWIQIKKAFDPIKIEEWIQREPSPDGIPTTLRKIVTCLRNGGELFIY
jgi:hypothetical protein